MSCALCDKPISNSDAYFELKCGLHLGHSHHGTLKCATCDKPAPDVHPPPPAQAVKGPMPVIVASRSTERYDRMLKREQTEPLAPVQAKRGYASSFIGGLLSKVSVLMASGGPVEDSSDPFVLLGARVPLKEVMVGRHAIGITELINDHGVTINDFFCNGYSIGDMCEAFPARMTRENGLDVLGNLGMHEEHFRRLPELAQIGIARDKLGYSPSDMVRRFGLEYKSPKTEDGWTLAELVRVGMDMPLIMEAGLKHRHEWEELKQTGTAQEVALFKATPALVSSLVIAVVHPPLPLAVQEQPQQQQQQYQSARNLLYSAPAMQKQPPVVVVAAAAAAAKMPREQQATVATPAVKMAIAEPVLIPPQILAQAKKQQQYTGPRLLPKKMA